MTPGSVAPRTARSVRPFSQLQPDQPVEMYFSLTTFQYGPMQHPAIQPISFLILSTPSSDSPGSLSLAKITYLQIKTTTLPCNATATKPHAAQLSTLIFHIHHSCLEPYRLHLQRLSFNTGSQVSQPRRAL